jgi:tetratricopeptide (TPR) repeat protein
MKEGGHGIPILYRQDKMREALQVFKDLINEYPNSDKIDDAAFQCGEIHKEYFQNDEWIAVQWYERAHEWDPETPHPALFGAAVLYDYRLHDRARALELYQLVLEKESQFESNANFAVRRIQELTEGMDRLPEPSTRTRTAGHMPQEGEQSMGRGGTGDSITADATAPIVERTGEPGSGG